MRTPIHRRRALTLLGAAALAARGARAQQGLPLGLSYAALDHIEFYVSNVERSRDFFVRVFGNTLLRNNTAGKRYLKLGSAYMAFETRPQIRVDHFCASIRDFNMLRLHALLEAQGIAYRDYPSGRDTGVNDPDGIRTQLSPENGWSILNPPNFNPEPIALTEPPIFRPTGIDHILLNVTDPEASAAFYERFLGPVSQRGNNRIWFQLGRSRLGLLQTPAGARAGVNHYCVSAEPFDFDEVTRRLRAMGAKVEPSEAAGLPDFRDPDGARIQIKM